MNKLWTNLTHFAIELKQICLEQVWLFALLMPLVVLATIGVVHLHNKSKNTRNESEALVQAVTSTEITSAEVYMIVEKPIGELLAMDVYDSVRRGDELIAEQTTQDIMHNDASNKMLVTQPRRSEASMVTYLQPLKNKKSQKVAVQS